MNGRSVANANNIECHTGIFLAHFFERRIIRTANGIITVDGVNGNVFAPMFGFEFLPKFFINSFGGFAIRVNFSSRRQTIRG